MRDECEHGQLRRKCPICEATEQENRYTYAAGQLYQVVGWLLIESGRWETDEGKEILNLLAQMSAGNPPDEVDLLPFPKEDGDG